MRVLISTTIGLVGNESTKTQTVCIVGLLYNIPSIIQCLGRIRPQRRTDDSQCTIFTNESYNFMLERASVKGESDCAQLISCKLLDRANRGKYLKSMTVNSVNGWLFHDMGCRIVSLCARLGYKHAPCKRCDRCTNTTVSRCRLIRRKRNEESNTKMKAGIKLLEAMKNYCVVCKKTTCIGTCVANSRQRRRRIGIVCFKCLGNHSSANCDKKYESAFMNKACYCCFQYNYSIQARHNFDECRNDGGIKDRLRCLLHHDYCEKVEQRGDTELTFQTYMSGVYATPGTYFDFLYKYSSRM